VSTYSHGPNLHHGDQGYVAHRGHTLRTALRGCILEFTNPEGQHPHSSLVVAMSLV
jgi:hypothetical protein